VRGASHPRRRKSGSGPESSDSKCSDIKTAYSIGSKPGTLRCFRSDPAQQKLREFSPSHIAPTRSSLGKPVALPGRRPGRAHVVGEQLDISGLQYPCLSVLAGDIGSSSSPGRRLSARFFSSSQVHTQGVAYVRRIDASPREAE
jgi:hypothetical protein